MVSWYYLGLCVFTVVRILLIEFLNEIVVFNSHQGEMKRCLGLLSNIGRDPGKDRTV